MSMVAVWLVAPDANVLDILDYLIIPGSAFVGSFGRLDMPATGTVADFTTGTLQARCGLDARKSLGLTVACGMALETIWVVYFIALENIETPRVLGSFPGLVLFHMANAALIGAHIMAPVTLLGAPILTFFLGIIGNVAGVGNQTGG